MPNKNTIMFVDNREQIETFIQSSSLSMYEYIKNHPSEFTLGIKNLLHSDITNRGKRNGKNQNLSRNYLYYLSVEEMEKIQQQFPEKPFESAKKSNIRMPNQFYTDIGIPRLERRKRKQQCQHSHIKLNENSKTFSNIDDIILNQEEAFTEIQITQDIHGLGTSKDSEFQNFRLNDTIIFLAEHEKDKKNYILC